MLNTIISLIFLGCFYATALSAASSNPPIESISFNAGTHTEFYNSVQIDQSGGTRKFEFAPVLGAGISMPLDYGWRFLPEFNWMLPFQKGSDSKIIKNLFMLRADFGYQLRDWARFRVGTSLMILNQHGQGGTTTVNNGTTASTFYYPDENHSSLNNTFDLGGELMYKEYSVRLQTYTYSLFKKERRQVSYSLFFTYNWDI